MKTILVDGAYTFTIEKDGRFVIFSEMQDLLDSYPNRKIILTGADKEKQKFYALDKVPYELFTLNRNPEKANPEYYRILLDKFNLDISNVVYFEHTPEAVKSAQSLGIDTYFYDDNKKDLTELKKFLDENL